MDLLEVGVTGPGADALTAIASLFERYGMGGAVFEEDASRGGLLTVKAYLRADDAEARREVEIGLELLARAHGPLSPGPVFRHISGADWAEEWKKSYGVMRIGGGFVVRPSWKEYTPLPGDVVIELDPGMAFGSGLHTTTRLCLLAMEKYCAPGMSVLDVGTGSGILAIAAALMGARRVLAIDNDPVAVEVAAGNVALNGVGGVVETAAASPEQTPVEKWDLVFANILAETIAGMCGELRERLAGEGVLVLSGIIESRRELVEDALFSNGLTVVETMREGEWLGVIAGHVRRAGDAT